MARSNFFHLYTTGVSLNSLVPIRIRSFNSSGNSQLFHHSDAKTVHLGQGALFPKFFTKSNFIDSPPPSLQRFHNSALFDSQICRSPPAARNFAPYNVLLNWFYQCKKWCRWPGQLLRTLLYQGVSFFSSQRLCRVSMRPPRNFSSRRGR
jgi:hypothetical protein